MTTNTNELGRWIGRTAVDKSGDKIGKVADIYLDEDTNQPEWLAVKTGMFGSHVSFIPLAGATSTAGDEVKVPFESSQVKDAPHAEPDGALSQEEEARLYAHYGLNYTESRSDSGLPAGGAPQAPATGGDDDAMTRSEEEARIAKTQREAGRVRLRKWVDTEHVSETVALKHDEVRIEREPITEGNIDKALKGPEISEAVHEVVLTEEEVVVETEVVPKERIRLDKDTVTEQEQVELDLRKERVEVEGGTTGTTADRK